MTEVWHKDGSASTLVKLAYGYDPVGNRKYKEDLKSGLSSWSEVYFYDGLHRLRDFRRGTLNGNKDGIATAVSPPLTYTQEWLDFDLLGNWLQSKTRVATTPTPTLTTDDRTVNSVNEYLTQQINGGSTTNFANDDTGNLTDDGNQEYVYDAENRLIEVLKKGSPDETIQEYQYDALGRRVVTIDNCPSSCSGGCNGMSANTTRTTRHIFAGTPACIEEYDPDASPVLQRYFVHGEQFPDPLAMVDNTDVGAVSEGTAEFFWYLKDALGSIVALKNSSDTVVERYVYDPYGKTTVTNASGTPLSAPTDCIAAATPSAYANPFCWTGQRYDARTGLYHFWFRSYSPGLGRWLQRDPAGAVDGPSLYQYSISDPIGHHDPLGLETPIPRGSTPDLGVGPDGRPIRGKPRKGNDPTAAANGCSFVSDTWFGVSFKPACDQHDRCYSTLGKTKAECDREFLSDLLAICTTLLRGTGKYGWAQERECRNIAYRYYEGVRDHGHRAYNRRQRDAKERRRWEQYLRGACLV